jgi:hypothetical protein
MAKSYLEPLLALSGEAMFAGGRTQLISNLSLEELDKVVGEGLIDCSDRKVKERLIVAMLDILKDHAEAEVAAVPEGSKYPFIKLSGLLLTCNYQRPPHLRPSCIVARNFRVTRDDAEEEG